MNALLEKELQEAAAQTEHALQRYLQDKDPATHSLYDSMRYSTMAGGKRIRPYLTLAVCRAWGGQEEDALPFAAAVEMVHTYSLIHDDLPAMDNDTMRRGRPTNHMVYGEAAAILAGDALLTMAFDVIARAPVAPERIVDAVHCLAQGAGADGMVGGQIMDITAESTPPSLAVLGDLYDRKTGALLAIAAELGAIAAGVTDSVARESCRRYALSLGRAFQIVDDVLDVYGDEAILGKKTGQDAADGKTTYMTYLSREEAMQAAEAATAQAKDALRAWPQNASLLLLADYLLTRKK